MHLPHYSGRRRRPIIEDQDWMTAVATAMVLVLGIILAVALWCAVGD